MNRGRGARRGGTARTPTLSRRSRNAPDSNLSTTTPASTSARQATPEIDEDEFASVHPPATPAGPSNAPPANGTSQATNLRSDDGCKTQTPKKNASTSAGLKGIFSPIKQPRLTPQGSLRFLFDPFGNAIDNYTSPSPLKVEDFIIRGKRARSEDGGEDDEPVEDEVDDRLKRMRSGGSSSGTPQPSVTGATGGQDAENSSGSRDSSASPSDANPQASHEASVLAAQPEEHEAESAAGAVDGASAVFDNTGDDAENHEVVDNAREHEGDASDTALPPADLETVAASEASESPAASTSSSGSSVSSASTPLTTPSPECSGDGSSEGTSPAPEDQTPQHIADEGQTRDDEVKGRDEDVTRANEEPKVPSTAEAVIDNSREMSSVPAPASGAASTSSSQPPPLAQFVPVPYPMPHPPMPLPPPYSIQNDYRQMPLPPQYGFFFPAYPFPPGWLPVGHDQAQMPVHMNPYFMPPHSPYTNPPGVPPVQHNQTQAQAPVLPPPPQHPGTHHGQFFQPQKPVPTSQQPIPLPPPAQPAVQISQAQLNVVFVDEPAQKLKVDTPPQHKGFRFRGIEAKVLKADGSMYVAATNEQPWNCRRDDYAQWDNTVGPVPSTAAKDKKKKRQSSASARGRGAGKRGRGRGTPK